MKVSKEYRYDYGTRLTALEILGTIAFAVSGAFVAIKAKFDAFGALVIGCITAVGGGILRDILTETPPYIFKKHIYAVASIGGAVLYYVVRYYCEYTVLATALTLVTIVAVRLLAAHFRWSLPKIPLTDENLADEIAQNDLLNDVAVGDVLQSTQKEDNDQE